MISKPQFTKEYFLSRDGATLSLLSFAVLTDLCFVIYDIIPDFLCIDKLYIYNAGYSECKDYYKHILLIAGVSFAVAFVVSLFRIVYLNVEARNGLKRLSLIFGPILILSGILAILEEPCRGFICIPFFPLLFTLLLILFVIFSALAILRHSLTVSPTKEKMAMLAASFFALVFFQYQILIMYDKHENNFTQSDQTEQDCRRIWNSRKKEICLERFATFNGRYDLCGILTESDLIRDCFFYRDFSQQHPNQ
jgi:hypothetical protein